MRLDSVYLPTMGTVSFDINGNKKLVADRNMLKISSYSWNNPEPCDNYMAIEVDVSQCRADDVLTITLPPVFTDVDDLACGEPYLCYQKCINSEETQTMFWRCPYLGCDDTLEILLNISYSESKIICCFPQFLIDAFLKEAGGKFIMTFQEGRDYGY